MTETTNKIMRKERKYRLRLYLDQLPPTDNRLYISILKRGKYGKGVIPIRTLTPEARTYKRNIQEKVAEALMSSRHTTPFSADKPYECSIILYFQNIECKGWPDKGTKRFKKVDISNRGKIIIDAVMESLGIDDSQILKVTMQKRRSNSDNEFGWFRLIEAQDWPPQT